MVIHILTILFVILFWNTTVTINGFNKNIVLPFSLVCIGIVFGVYLIIKSIGLFSSIKNSFLSNKSKIDKAKDKCQEALLSYISGSNSYANKIWNESKKYLENDKLFVLLSAVTNNLDNLNQEKVSQMPGYNVLKEYFNTFGIKVVKQDSSFDEKNHVSTLSKRELLNIIKEYKSPWAYEALIYRYLENADDKLADDILKKYVKTDQISANQWKPLKAKVFLAQAKQEKTKEKQIKAMRKANRLDPSLAIFELVEYYKNKNDLSKARRVIEDAWALSPSIKLGKLYTELDEFDAIPIHKFQHARVLSKINEDHPISHVLVATYAMESQLWAIAMEYLNKFKEQYPALACMLLARLEANKSGNNIKVWKNIERAFVLVAKNEHLDVDGIV